MSGTFVVNIPHGVNYADDVKNDRLVS